MNNAVNSAVNSAESQAAPVASALNADATVRDDGLCFHCGLPRPAEAPWRVRIDGIARAMCCPGCEAVAQGIVEAGCADYYRQREGYATSAAGKAATEDMLALLRLYDENGAMPASTETAADAAGNGNAAALCDGTFTVEDLRCAACVWLIEKRMRQLPGVLSAEMNATTGRLQVQWRDADCKPSDILRALRGIGYTAWPYDPARHSQRLERAGKTLFRRFFIAGLSMMQVMMFSLPFYLATDGTMEPGIAALMRWAMLLLTLPAVTYAALPFYRGAWAGIRHGMPGMDVPVALGILAAFAGSTLATLRGRGDLWFDSITMFIFLLLASRALELSARRKAASARDALQHALPQAAWRYPAGSDADAGRHEPVQEPEQVPVESLRVGDVVRVRPGETVPADGTILRGATSVDVSLLTGESMAQQRAAGAFIPGGAVNVSQAIVLRVDKIARDSTLSGLVRLAERSAQTRPHLALWADRVAAWFVTLLLVFAAVVFLVWQILDPSRAWEIAVAVLVVSCPCALSLATPTALAVATEQLLRRGVLVVQPHVLETLVRATHIVFDKTGTLTMGRPVLTAMRTFGDADGSWCLRAAAALEQESAHPFAQAFRAAADAAISGKDAGKFLCASAITQYAGQGIDGVVAGRAVRLGSRAFVAALGAKEGGDVHAEVHADGHADVPAHPPADSAVDSIVDAEAGEESGSTVWLGDASGLLACFMLEDALRPEAADVVRHFQAPGKTVLLLSGDAAPAVARVAATLGIADARGTALPADKLAAVQALQRDGAVVAMVGDGINDAAVLGAADVSFAMGQGAALAQTHADCVLLSGQLAALCTVSLTAQRTLAVVRQNLAWATVYNAIAIPAAALGWINPWMSAIGMSASSAAVVCNALRLRWHAGAQAPASSKRVMEEGATACPLPPDLTEERNRAWKRSIC